MVWLAGVVADGRHGSRESVFLRPSTRAAEGAVVSPPVGGCNLGGV